MELKHYKEEKPHFYKRVLWTIINHTIFRCLCHWRLYFLKNSLLRLFGAKLPNHTNIYSSCTIYAPWNLTMGLHSTIGPNTIIYNKAPITIGSNVTISQYSHLCSASHDITTINHALICSPITICDKVWIAADALIGPGVTIGEGAVVGARAAVFKDVEPWTVVGGNPAKFIKKRMIKDEKES